MTAADTETAAAVTGITDDQMSALRRGGWHDDDSDTPGWRREAIDGDKWVTQWVFPSFFDCDSRWNADSDGGSEWVRNFEEAMKVCDGLANGYPSGAGTATKQEDRFARRAAKQEDRFARIADGPPLFPPNLRRPVNLSVSAPPVGPVRRPGVFPNRLLG